ncbi:MAG: hypothetical protein OJF50_005225 [Nitrospira sp.]|nr:hypothetical protein [Nitrospira sp.]
MENSLSRAKQGRIVLNAFSESQRNRRGSKRYRNSLPD